MVDIYSIRVGTVFAWFMLILMIRRITLVVMLVIIGMKKGSAKSNNDDVIERINGCLTNDSENDTYFLILYLGTAIYSYSLNPDLVRMIVYGSIYLFARIMHSTMYVAGIQPARTLCYLVGLLCTFAMNLDLVILMSRASN